MKRIILTFLALVALCSVGQAARMETYYLHGFTQRGSSSTAPYAVSGSNGIQSVGDSIPFGTTFTSRWIPIFGARQVIWNFRCTSADSDSVVSVLFANADTAAASVVTASFDTTGSMTGMLGQGVSVLTPYRGTGGTSWGPADAKTINIVPFQGSTSKNNFIPMRWVRFKVTAPTRQCTGGASGQACNSIHGVRMWVHVIHEDEGGLKGADPLYPFHGTYP